MFFFLFKSIITSAGEEDFETFMESVKARSLAARTRAIASQGMNIIKSICYFLTFIVFPLMA